MLAQNFDRSLLHQRLKVIRQKIVKESYDTICKEVFERYNKGLQSPGGMPEDAIIYSFLYYLITVENIWIEGDDAKWDHLLHNINFAIEYT